MANTITAGNGTNNGLAVASDATGALNILTGSGGGTAAISIDSSQNVTMAANQTVAGNLSVTGNTTITGTLTATNGVSGGNSLRAWVNFNGTGTVAIRASFNVSSITDNGTGSYTVNYTTALSDANYSIVAAQGPISLPGQSIAIAGTPSTTSVPLGVGGVSAGSAVAADAATVNILVFR